MIPEKPEPFWIAPLQEPRVVAEAASYLVVYKPPRMHTAPLRQEEANTLLAWAGSHFPEVLHIQGRKENEGGLLHRLDYETHGLVLIARTEAAFAALKSQQEKDLFAKEYDAVCEERQAISEAPNLAEAESMAGFPPYTGDVPAEGICVESAFRPFGKGRKQVRPLPAQSSIKDKSVYQTEILSCAEDGSRHFLRLRIHKGFRHQIRCHLAWIKRPLLNDSLYGGNSDGGFLALRASALAFSDPESGEAREYSLF